MVEPPYPSPKHWARLSLEPCPAAGYIVRVESGGTPSTSDEECWDGDIPWLTPKEITGNTTLFVSTTERTITDKGMTESAAKLLPVGTVCLTKRAPVGAVALNAVPLTTNQGFLNFLCGEKLRPLLLAYWFQANTQYLQQIANGSTYLELYQADLFEFELAVPSLDEQDAILGVIGSLQYVSLLGLALEQSVSTPVEMLAVQDQNRRLLRIRNTLAAQLVTGQIGVDPMRPQHKVSTRVPYDQQRAP